MRAAPYARKSPCTEDVQIQCDAAYFIIFTNFHKAIRLKRVNRPTLHYSWTTHVSQYAFILNLFVSRQLNSVWMRE